MVFSQGFTFDEGELVYRAWDANTALDLHFAMFLPTILGQGTKDQVDWTKFSSTLIFDHRLRSLTGECKQHSVKSSGITPKLSSGTELTCGLSSFRTHSPQANINFLQWIGNHGDIWQVHGGVHYSQSDIDSLQVVARCVLEDVITLYLALDSLTRNAWQDINTFSGYRTLVHRWFESNQDIKLSIKYSLNTGKDYGPHAFLVQIRDMETHLVRILRNMKIYY